MPPITAIGAHPAIGRFQPLLLNNHLGLAFRVVDVEVGYLPLSIYRAEANLAFISSRAATNTAV